MADGFTRSLEDIEKAFIMACSRRTASIAKRDQAEVDLMMHTRHVDLCDRQITLILDEKLRAANNVHATA